MNINSSLSMAIIIFVGASTASGAIWNVDFEQLSSQGSYKQQMVGPGPNGGVGSAGDFWNVFVLSEAGTAAPVGQALLDSGGAASGMTLTFTAVDSGTLGAFGHAPTAIDDLTAEYLFLGPQNNCYVADWEITGLSPGGDYSLYLYTGGYDAVNGSHNADYDLDVDGDGFLDGVAAIVSGTNAPTVIDSVTADGTGKIIGQFLHNYVGESEIGGFQLTLNHSLAIIEPNGPMVISEDNETADIFIVKLSAEPANDVMVTFDPYTNQNDFKLNSEDAGDSVTLSFTSSNWGTPQTVTIQAVDDVYEEGQESCEIAIILSSSDPYYNGLFVMPVTFNVLDNDRAGDLNGNSLINPDDLFMLTQQWLAQPCSPDSWCGLADITAIMGQTSEPGIVNWDDFAVFAARWLQVPLLVSEFMASNGSSVPLDAGEILDGNGESSDWIEIYNAGSIQENLEGYYLTDTADNLTKWEFPAGATINAGQYLLIFASGRDDIEYPYVDPSGYYHTNFKLSADGEYLALVMPDGQTLVNEYDFPEQERDLSYGLYNNQVRYFGFPTPGAPNSDGYIGMVADTKFSHNRGFYDTPFSVIITTDTSRADIRYTLDGSEPTLTHGTDYTAPIPIVTTRCLRAGAFKMGWGASDVDTQSYIFLDNVVVQTKPTGYPNVWVGYSGDYDMDPDIVTAVPLSDSDGNPFDVKDALLAIPTLSVAMDFNDFLGDNGFYLDPYLHGMASERPASVEYIDPEEGPGFQVNCGIRIHGGYLRHPAVLKHSLRLFFRAMYGQSRLEFPFFADTSVDSFGALSLRAGGDLSWANPFTPWHRLITTYHRDQFSRDLQRDMGHLTLHGNFVHLYINGMYWGLYNPTEWPRPEFAESYLGGDEDDYDVIKSNYGAGGYDHELVDGEETAWNTMIAIANSGVGDSDMYGDVPAYEAIQEFLDCENLIDYIIVNVFLCNSDWPHNNWYAIRKRQPEAKFHFLCWDAETTIESIDCNKIGVSWLGTSNPGRLFVKLRENSEFRLLVADRMHRHLFNGGVLTPQASADSWEARRDEIDRAIAGESARWGDVTREPPYTRGVEWLDGENYVLNEYLTNGGNATRSEIVLGQFKNEGMYPNVDAPSFNQHGGEVPAGFDLTINAPLGAIYYTTNGQDPRLMGGAINPNALVFEGGGGSQASLVGENDSKTVLIPDAPVSDDWKSDPYFNDSGWNEYAYVLGKSGGVGYDIPTAYDQYITYDVEAGMYETHDTCYVRIPFTISEDPDDLEDMTLKVRYDDGFVAYINGQEVARANFDGTPAWDSYATYGHEDGQAVNFENFDVSAYLDVLQQGDNILAIHGLNFYRIPTPSSDLLVSVELMATVASAPPPPDSSIPLNLSTCLKTRAKDGSTWSALNEAKFSVGPVLENFRITEMMYHPQDLPDGEPYAEFIELKNIGTETINLNLVTFTHGVDFTFGNVNLPAGDYIVVVKEQSAFDLQYPTFSGTIGGEYIGSLDNGGERIRLEDAIGRTIQDFSYKDGWHDITDGEGFSLRINDPAAIDSKTWGYQRSWSASAYRLGSPGADDTGPQYGDIVINEVLAHSDGYPNDWIELHNTTGSSIDISGWFLSDNGKDDPNLMKYEIPASTSIPANGYVVFTQDDHFGSFFALSENGETAYLTSGLDGNGQLTDYREKEDFEASEAEVTFGRYQMSTGTFDFVAMDSKTFGSANSNPRVAPVVISEIMYHPDWLAGSLYNNEEFEYIEITNITGSAIDLYDNIEGQDVGWRFTDGVDYTFPIGTTIPAGGSLVVVENPTAFSERFPAVPALNIFGPYDGKLSNSGEKLELSKPGEHIWGPDYYYIRVDRVNYSDGRHHDDFEGMNDPWPTTPDGAGESLNRKVPANYGNDVISWESAAPSPGS